MLPVAVALAFTAQCSQPPLQFLRWEAEVRAVEKRLAAAPPAKGGVVFAGSSSVRRWDLPKSFPDLRVANVGFGGSQIPDCTFFAHRLITPLEPKVVVFYAGDNDLAAGRTPEQVRDDFAAFAAAVHARRPECRVLFLSVKPSPSRWKLIDAQERANRLVKGWCEKDHRVVYVDVAACLLGPDGKPDPALFAADKLHLSDNGYEKWATVLKGHLK